LNNINVIPIPGVSAFTTALMASWMQTNHFLYLGFLPIKKWRQTLFKSLKNRNVDETIVIYESVHRILKTLNEIWEYFWKDHKIVVARELTKKFEEFVRWEVREVLEYFEKNKDKVKWEFVVMF
jgi:16S rRNA (cytidine1402-2'-O)-methyltransferase